MANVSQTVFYGLFTVIFLRKDVCQNARAGTIPRPSHPRFFFCLERGGGVLEGVFL